MTIKQITDHPKVLRGIILGNIFALLSAVCTLIWSVAVLTTEFKQVKVVQATNTAVLAGVVESADRLEERMNAQERLHALLDGRVFRLESINLHGR